MINQLNPQQQNFRAALYNVAMQSGIDPRAVDMLLQALQYRQQQRQGTGGGMPQGTGGGLPRGPAGGLPQGTGGGLPRGPAGFGGPMGRPAMHPQQRQLMRQLRQLLGPNFRPMLRNMLHNGQVQNGLQTPNPSVNNQQAAPNGNQKNVNRQDGLININNQININHCGCGPKDQVNNNAIKGDEKGGWLAKHGGYKKRKDGSFDITKGKYAGHKAVPIGKGKYNVVGPNGQSVGQYSSPKGKDKIASPLTFDLNGDGVSTTDVQNGKTFDINGDGKADQTAWAGKGDGVLAFDANKDGVAGGDGKELLGNNTDVDGDGKADGHKNGFEALKALAQKNLGFQAVADGKLDQWELQQLEQKTGLTMNVDGQNKSLGELGITEVNLGYTEAGQNADANGNEHRQVGAGFVRNGRRGQVNDVWFKYQ